MKNDIKQELRAEVRPKGEDGFGVFLVQVGDGFVVDCVAEYSGPLAYEGACRQAGHGGRQWASNVPGDLPQAQSNLAAPPFMTIVSGNAVINDGVTAEPLAETWTGVCCTTAKSFWYIGREQNERSFHKLVAFDYLEAVQEARHLVKSLTSFERYPRSQSLIQSISDRYRSVDDARDALTTISALAGFVFGYVDDRERRTVSFHVAGTTASQQPAGNWLSRVFSIAREAVPTLAA